MSADRPIEIEFPSLARSGGTTNQDAPRTQPETESGDGDDFAWLAAAFAEDEDSPGGAQADDAHAPAAPEPVGGQPDRDSRAHDSADDPEPPSTSLPLGSIPELKKAVTTREPEESDAATVSSDHVSPPEPVTLPDVPIAIDDDQPDLAAPGERTKTTAHVDPIDDGIEDAAENNHHQSVENLRKRPGFREELLAAFSQIYKK